MPDTAVTVPLFGFGYGAKSPNVSAQQRENLYVEMLKDPDKTALALYQRPGLLTVNNSSSQPGPIRGVVTLYSNSHVGGGGIVQNVVYSQGTDLCFLSPGGGITPFHLSGVILTSSGPVRAAQVGVPSVFVDGTTGYILDDPSTGIVTNLSTVPTAASFPFTTPYICSVASRFVAVDPSQTGRFRWSAAGDGRTWNALDFATAESSPDPLCAVFEMAGQLLLIGSDTMEFWSPTATGAANQLPFQRVGGANIQWGTTAIDTIRKCNDSVIFLGRNQGGNRQVVQLKGYDAQVVSTPDIDAIIAAQSNENLDAAVAMYIVVAGHKFYVLNIPGISGPPFLPYETLVYDTTTDSWAKWTTNATFFAGNLVIPIVGGDTYITDPANGNIYKFDPNTYADGGAGILRRVTSKHAWANLARMSLRELRIDCQTGVPANLSLAWSTDGGNTFCTPVPVALNTSGTLTTAVWRNLGRARDWVFQLTMTDPVQTAIIGAAAIFQP